MVQPGRRSGKCGAGVVLDVADRPIVEFEGVRPGMTLAFVVGPGEGDGDSRTVLVDGVDAAVLVAV